MATRIRLARGGSKKRPVYRIVVTDKRNPRDGSFIEKLGTYNPMLPKDSADRFVINAERAKFWIANGATPSDTLAKKFAALGIAEESAKVVKLRAKATEISQAAKKEKDAVKKAEADAKAAEAKEAADAAKVEADAKAAEEKAAAVAAAEEAKAEESTVAEAPAEEAKAEETPAA